MAIDGVVLTMSSDYFVPTTATAIGFGTATTFGAKTWWNVANAGRLVIPTGVTRAKIYAGGAFTADDDGSYLCQIQENGTTAVADLAPFSSGRGAGNGLILGLREVTPADYYRLLWRRYFGGATLDADYTFLAAFTPESVIGLTAANLASDTAFSTEQTLSWGAPEYDNLVTHNGTSGFVAPSGAEAAIVSIAAISTSQFVATEPTTYRLRKNGTAVTLLQGYHSWWAAGSVFMPISVTPGDVLSINAVTGQSGGTLDATYTRVGIEWLG